MYILTFYLTFLLPYTLTFFLAYTLTLFPAFYLESILTYFLAYMLTFFLASILASYRAFYLTVSLTWAGWGPTVPTEIQNSQFISEEEEKKPSTGRSGTKNVQPDPYPEPTGRSIPPSHTPNPDQNAGDPDRSIHPDHRGPIHSQILTQPFLIIVLTTEMWHFLSATHLHTAK